LKVVEKIKTHILGLITFSGNCAFLRDDVEKCGGTKQVTVDNVVQRMRFACWITMTTHTHTQNM
jgi:hypothetical protein